MAEVVAPEDVAQHYRPTFGWPAADVVGRTKQTPDPWPQPQEIECVAGDEASRNVAPRAITLLDLGLPVSPAREVDERSLCSEQFADHSVGQVADPFGPIALDDIDAHQLGWCGDGQAAQHQTVE